MNGASDKEDRPTRILRRVARVWSLVIVVIGGVIFVGEILEWLGRDPAMVQPYPWFENLMPLAMATAVLGLVIAWRWEVVGSVITIVSVLVVLVVFYGVIGGRGRAPWIVLVIMTPVLIPGVLYLVCGLREWGQMSGVSSV